MAQKAGPDGARGGRLYDRRLVAKLRVSDTRWVRKSVRKALASRGLRLVSNSGRNATVFPDDRILVSFPRSGNTWVSFLLTNLLHPDDPTRFLNLEERCPDIYQHDDKFLLDLARPRLLKSHEPFDPSYKRVLYLVRDPTDVAASYFTFLKKIRTIPIDLPMTDFVEGFLAGVWPPEYGTWGEHVGSWLGARDADESFLILRYEDFKAEPIPTLQRAATFFGLPGSVEQCERAISLSTPERMRSIESEEISAVPELKNTRLDIPFIGSAEVGRGKVALSPEDQAKLRDRWPELLNRLGYDVTGPLHDASG